MYVCMYVYIYIYMYNPPKKKLVHLAESARQRTRLLVRGWKLNSGLLTPLLRLQGLIIHTSCKVFNKDSYFCGSKDSCIKIKIDHADKLNNQAVNFPTNDSPLRRLCLEPSCTLRCCARICSMICPVQLKSSPV